MLAIIPARGGSKRVLRKNVKNFLGKPLVERSIDVAKESGIFDKIVLITDDGEIAEIGRKAGIDVVQEPAELAADGSYIFDVLCYAVKKLKEEERYESPWFFLLEPSSPGRQPFHIKEIADLLSRSGDFDAIVGISKVPSNQTPLKALILNDDKSIIRQDGELIRNFTHQTQNIAPFYHINSAIYAFQTKNLFAENPNLWGNRVYGYVMDSKYALDIDTPDDWDFAEFKMKKLLQEKK